MLKFYGKVVVEGKYVFDVMVLRLATDMETT